MTARQRGELERLARSQTAPAREVRQARALLWAADGVLTIHYGDRIQAAN